MRLKEKGKRRMQWQIKDSINQNMLREDLIKNQQLITNQQFIKGQKGITLLALIITIVLLLIVSGVTLNATLGDNGLFKKSKEAVNKSKLARNRRSNKNGLISSIHRCRISRRGQAKQ